MKTEQGVILEFERKLTKSQVESGLILAGVERKEYLPPPKEEITVYDDERREYIARMNASSFSRIDRLTDWYHNHPTAKVGDTVVITIYSDKNIKLSLKK